MNILPSVLIDYILGFIGVSLKNLRLFLDSAHRDRIYMDLVAYDLLPLVANDRDLIECFEVIRSSETLIQIVSRLESSNYSLTSEHFKSVMQQAIILKDISLIKTCTELAHQRCMPMVERLSMCLMYFPDAVEVMLPYYYEVSGANDLSRFCINLIPDRRWEASLYSDEVCRKYGIRRPKGRL